MENSEKNIKYLKIMSLILPYARSTQTWSIWKRLRANLYEELELIHGVPQLMETPEVTVFDVYWINTQARNYAAACAKTRRVASEDILQLIDELISLVPTQLNEQLKWRNENSALTALDNE